MTNACMPAADPAARSRALRLVASLQVVTSPLLDPRFQLGPPAGERVNPVYHTAWESFKNLSATMVRYQPWFPQPRKAIAALLPPDHVRKETSWDFSHVLPQLNNFARMVGLNPMVLNFGTLPCWLFATTPPLNCDPPAETANPDSAAYWVSADNLTLFHVLSLALSLRMPSSFFILRVLVRESWQPWQPTRSEWARTRRVL